MRGLTSVTSSKCMSLLTHMDEYRVGYYSHSRGGRLCSDWQGIFWIPCRLKVFHLNCPHASSLPFFCLRAEGAMRTMSVEKLLKGMPTLQSQIDALLDFDVSDARR